MHGVPPGDGKSIHGQATRRTTETQIYFLNTVDITVSGNAWAFEVRYLDAF